LLNHEITYDIFMKRNRHPRCPLYERSRCNAPALRRPWV